MRAAVDLGRLRIEGRARATRYVEAGLTWGWPREGLEEHTAWAIVARSAPVSGLGAEARQIAQYAFSVSVNNAIDHSGAERVRARLQLERDHLRFVVEDDGEGALAHVRRLAGLPDQLTAAQEISKGRFTTDPTRHTGEGIFFSSKAVARFELRSGSLAWIADNRVGEVALMEVPEQVGTRVTFDVADPPTRSLLSIFEEYTDDLLFVRTRTIVKLFEYGREFVSRSEAKRLLAGLERFREVIVDFTGVTGVGQGFADEVFRVWPGAHPQTRVTAANMRPVVAFMVGRAGGITHLPHP